VIAEATQLVQFVIFIDQCSSCLNTEWDREKNGQEPHHAVRRPVVAVIVRMGTVNGWPLTVEAVAHKDVERDRQLLPSKHVLKIAVREVFLERNVCWLRVFRIQFRMKHVSLD
jgi:hypothetical protein